MKRRNTPTKQAVLDLFDSRETALNQEQIELQLQEKMDRAPIYRILNNFCEDGVMHKVVGDDGINYFAMCKTSSFSTCILSHPLFNLSSILYT